VLKSIIFVNIKTKNKRMKFIVSSTLLLKHLQTVGGVINSSSTLPILDNFLFEISGNQLTVSASDLETTMSTVFEVKSDEEGATAINARMLLDTLKTFPDQPLSFVYNAEKQLIEISSDYGKYGIATQKAEEFPKVPAIEEASTSEIKADLLASAIMKTLFATGNDELRPVMSGVFFELATDKLSFVATDAHKLVRYIRTDAKSENNASFIMPKKPLNLLKGVLVGSDNMVKISYNDKNAQFDFDCYSLNCRLIDGKYPNYDAVIPKENPNKLSIDRVSLLNSVKRVSIFANKATHQVRLKIAGNELHISAEDLDFANKAAERLTCQYEGEDMEIGFNSRFMSEMLGNLESDNVSLEMSAPNRAGILTPTDNTEDGEDVLMLVMPVMLNN
jgi:DNA polymerase-3 subunit beta